MKKKLISLVVLFLVGALLLLIVPACAGPQPVNLTFMSASPGGSWYPLAVGAAEIWQKNITDSQLSFTHTPGGGVANAQGVDEGIAQVAVTTSVTIGQGLMNMPPFEKPLTNISTLAATSTQYFTITTFKESGIRELDDLKGKALSPTKKGWTVESLVVLLLDAAGISYDDLAKVEFVTGPEAAALLKDGHIDAFADSYEEVADPLVVELSLFKELWFIPVPQSLWEGMGLPGLVPYTVPGGTIRGVDQDVPTFAFTTGIAVSPDLDEDLVYQMTKTLVENWSDMGLAMESLKGRQPQELAVKLGADFHPGAAKYYKERGWIQ
jgi:TRAP transporter TAXI family solute receptor